MKTTALRKAALPLPLVAILALPACGGGGGGSHVPMSPTAPKISETDTDGATTRSSTAHLNFAADSASLTGDAYIKSISDDGSGGYNVAYVVGGEEFTVAFTSETLGADDSCGCNDYYVERGGYSFWFWIAGSGQHSTRFGSSWRPSERSRFESYAAMGTETGATGLPDGSATFRGNVHGRHYDNNHEDGGDRSRARLRGHLTLEVDFADASLGGRIYNLRIQESGAGGPYNPLPGSRIDVRNGRIADGEFTAGLATADDDPALDGLEGEMQGAFYGPGAAEVGGVFTAKRDSGGRDEVVAGSFGGEKFTPADLGAEALITGLDLDFDPQAAQPTRLMTDVGEDRIRDAQVERTEDGWTVTVRGKGTGADTGLVTVELRDAEDYGASPGFWSLYHRDLGNDESAVFWTRTRGFGPSPEFNHFDVKGWSYITWKPEVENPLTADSSEDAVTATYATVVHGDRTPEAAMPASGTATYTGSMQAREFPGDSAVSSLSPDATKYRGDAVLMADFGNAGVGGRLTELQSRPGDNSSPWADVEGELAFDAGIGGTIPGNRFTAGEITGTGDMAGYTGASGAVRGAFFGPAAEEAGGVFEASRSDTDKVIVGHFGGKREE